VSFGVDVMKNKGIIMIIISAFCFALMNVFVKLSGDIPSIEKSFFRNLVAAIIAFIMLIKSKEGFYIKKGNIPLLLGRAVCGTIGIIGNFYAVDHLLLADASIIQKLAPFFVIIFSYFILKERVNRIQILSIVIAFIGMLFIVKPSFHNTELIPSFIALIGAMAAGMAYTLVRKLSLCGVKGPQIVFYFSLFSCISVIPYIVIHFVPLHFNQFVYLLLAGIAAAGGQFSVTAAYSYAPAKEISVYDYSQVVFSAIFGFIFFLQIPDKYSFLGYALIFSVALLMFVKNNQRSLSDIES
jgi:drug/metabolite transporter (DMT)-like permease